MKTVSWDNPGTSVSLAWWNRMTEFCNPAWCHDWSLSSAFNVWSRSKWPALTQWLISVWVEQCRRMLSKPLHINAFFVIKGKVCSLVVYSFCLVRRADGQRLQINYSWLIIGMQVERTRKKALLTLRGSHVHERTISSAVIHKEHVQLEVVQTTRTDHVL